jgi:inhibitor of KinA sporulation pathway (predicted exonuclease)
MKLTEEEKSRITVGAIKEIAKDMFIGGDASFEDIADAINLEYHRNFNANTIHRWCIEGDWDKKKEKYEEEQSQMPIKISMRDLKEELDNKDYDRITELIEALEEKYLASPNGRDLTAIIAGYKFKKELRNSTIVDENHNEISMILAAFNQKRLSVAEKKDAIDVDISQELADASRND